MANVFDFLLQNTSKTRAQKSTDEKIKTILNNNEINNYDKSKNNRFDDLLDDFDNDDFIVGEEREVDDALSDIDKLSMKELDKMPAKEQLKKLKLEYNRVYDKLNTLNSTTSNNNRLISDLQMGSREKDGQVKEMKNLVRKIVHLFPGNTELKEFVDRGTWNVDEINDHVQNMVVKLVERVRQTDELIKSSTDAVIEENTNLKKQVLEYKKYVRQVVELEKKFNDLKNGKSSPSPSSHTPESNVTNNEVEEEVKKPTIQEVPSEKQAKPPFEELEVSPINNEEVTKEVESVPEHNPHFSDFFKEFEKEYTKMKDQNNQEENLEEKKEEPSNVINSDETESSKHPLSPDYVETEKEEVEDLFDDTIDAYIQNLSMQQEYLLKVIGKTGISRNADLREYLKKEELGLQYYYVGKKYNSSALNRDIAELRDKSILSDEQVSYGGKGGGNFNVYELSDKGKLCYKKINNDNPVVPEKKRIKAHHASLEHGYLIKDSAALFREMGYKVYTDLDDVSIKIDPKHRKVFDFIAENEEGASLHIEVERGTHTQEDFSYAMDKIYEITKDFYFICPNEQVKNKNTKKKFFTWVTKKFGSIKNADITLNMVTIEQLRKKPKNLWDVTDLRNV